jgi:hypothetical protein
MERLGIEPEHAAELSRVLDAALDRPPSARAQWIDSLPPTALRSSRSYVSCYRVPRMSRLGTLSTRGRNCGLAPSRKL